MNELNVKVIKSPDDKHEKNISKFASKNIRSEITKFNLKLNEKKEKISKSFYNPKTERKPKFILENTIISSEVRAKEKKVKVINHMANMSLNSNRSDVIVNQIEPVKNEQNINLNSIPVDRNVQTSIQRNEISQSQSNIHGDQKLLKEVTSDIDYVSQRQADKGGVRNNPQSVRISDINYEKLKRDHRESPERSVFKLLTDKNDM